MSRNQTSKFEGKSFFMRGYMCKSKFLELAFSTWSTALGSKGPRSGVWYFTIGLAEACRHMAQAFPRKVRLV